MCWKKSLRSIISIISSTKFKTTYMIAVLLTCAYFLYLKSELIYTLLFNGRISQLCLASLFIVLAIMGSTFIPFHIYRGMGISVPYSQVFRIVNFSNLGRYIPGKIFVAGNYLLFSREAGIRAENIGVSFLLFSLAMVGVGALLGLPLIASIYPDLKYYLVFLSLIIPFFFHSKVINRILPWGIRKLKGNKESSHEDMFNELKSLFYIKIFLLALICWVLTGLAFYYAINVFQPINITNLPYLIETIALSSTLGFIAIFAPAGVGVREGVGVFFLSRLISEESAFLAMMTIRLVGIVVDLGCGFLAMVITPKMSKLKTI